MRRPDEDLTPEEIAELDALLLAERPAPSPAFTATLDARVAARFPRPPAVPARARRREGLRRPLLPALATAAATLIAVTIALQAGDGGPTVRRAVPATSPPSAGAGLQAAKPETPDAAVTDSAGGAVERLAHPAPQARALSKTGAFRALTPTDHSTRKVERSTTLALGAPADRVDDVAQGVLGVVDRFDGIVDASSVATGRAGGTASFALRLPAARLGDALGQLSRLPHARVRSRTDDTADVNQVYTSIRRRLANARAERAGLLRALQAADTEDATLRLKARLDAVERTIAFTERAQRGLDRRISYSRVDVTIEAERRGAGGSGAFTPGRALHDAGRVLAVTAGVIVIAAAALVPIAIVLACGWPLARALQRRRREQALDAA